MADLWQYDTPEVARFKSYYQATPNFPEVLDSLTTTLSDPTSIKEKSLNIPSDPILVKAYPNPFNPQIKITVQVNNPGLLSMDIYNILGEKIKTYNQINLVNTEHTFIWNARSDHNEALTSGEYILYIQFTDRQQNQKFTEVKKILYLK